MITSVVILLLLLYGFFGRRLLFRNSDVHKIPGPWNFPFIGSGIRFVTTSDKVIALLDHFLKEFGRISVIWVGNVPVVNVSSAEGAEAVLASKTNIKKGRSYNLLQPWLGQGLLTSTGNRWFAHRRLITPTFHFSILETFLYVFQENSKILINQLEDAIKFEEKIKLQPFITRCALDIICEAAMGTKINAQKGSLLKENEKDKLTSQYIRSIFRISQLTTLRILNFLIRPEFIFFRLRVGKSYLKHLKIVHDFAEDVIRSRRIATKLFESNRNIRPAFLDLLLDARDAEGGKLSDKDIREEVDTFMFEGHDTTTAAMTWALYLLGTHHDIQEELYEEQIEVLGKDAEKPITLANLAEMKKLERVIKEVLRLYPSVPTVTREIEETIQIEGYNIPAGTSLLLHIYQIHRDPKVFPDPENFNPDRFLPENTAGRHPFAYIPFSAGPRNCIGQKFAMLEEKVVLSNILRSYKVEFIGELDKSQIRSELILRPPKNLEFKLSKRI